MGKSERRRGTRETVHSTAPQTAPAGKAGRAWRRHAWRLFALWALVGMAYSNSFQAGLVFDNGFILGRDPRIRQATAANLHSILTGEYSNVHIGAGLYRPATTLTYLLNYAVLGDGLAPSGYHWVNLALHEFNVALVYALGLLILGEAAPALALAALWGLHPVLTESVTNIIGRADLLAALGVLAGFWFYARSLAAQGRRRWACLAGLAASQALGIASKESAAVLPGVMLLFDLIWQERASWRKRLPAYALTALALGLYFFARAAVLHSGMHIELTENPLAGAGFWTARLTAIKVIGKYLWLFVWPARLSADYSYNAVPLFGWRINSREDLETLVALAVCLGGALLAGLLAFRWRRTGRPLLFFLGFFFLTLLPVSNLIIPIGSIMAERFLYLPSAGLAGCVVAGALLLGRHRSLQRPATARTARAVLGLVCLAWAARTYARNADWHDDRSLWTSAAEACPESARPHYNLANTLAGIPGMMPEALAEYRAALRIRPDNPDIHNNLGMALAKMPDRLPEAVAELQAALRLNPDSPEIHDNLGMALVKIPERAAEAIPQFEAALRAQPDSAELHNDLGLALAQTPGRMPEAIAQFRQSLRLNPDSPQAHSNLGRALFETPGQMQDAIAEYREALRLDPDSPVSHNNLGMALAKTPGQMQEAIAQFQASLGLAPDYPDAHYHLGVILAQIPGRQSEAIAELEAGERLSPDPAQLELLDRLRASVH